MTVYNLRSTELGYRITKFTDDLEVEATYNLSYISAGHNNFRCDCPAGVRPNCKHRIMLPRMMAHKDDGWFYDYEHQNWRRPLNDAAEGGSEPIVEPIEVDTTTYVQKTVQLSAAPEPMPSNHVSRR